MRIVGLSIFFLFVSTLGCSSNTLSVSPRVAMVNVPAGNNTFYSIEEVKLKFYGVAPGDWRGNGFSHKVVAVAEARYPDLFRRAPTAIPIALRAEVRPEVRQAGALLVFIGTLGAVGGVLPSVPWWNDWHFELQADAQSGRVVSTNMETRHKGWWSLVSPLGLITIPGESDAPKLSTAFTAGPDNVPPQFRNFMIECMVDMLAAELLKRDSRALALPTLGTVPSALPGQPTVLTPPDKNSAPF